MWTYTKGPQVQVESEQTQATTGVFQLGTCQRMGLLINSRNDSMTEVRIQKYQYKLSLH